MGLVLRLVTGSALSYAQMDDNLIYLDNKVTGSTGYITYFSGSDPTSSIVGQSLLFQTGSKMLMTGSFGVLGAITASFFVGDGSQLTNLPAAPAGISAFIATGSATASVDVANSDIFSIFYNSINCGRIDANLGNASYGDTTLKYTTTGTGNSAFGAGTLHFNTDGYDNTAIGYWSLIQNTSGFSNTAVGSTALQSNTIGYANTALGYGALKANTDGDTNVAIGGNSLEFNTTGSNNTAVGTATLNFNIKNNNTVIGNAAGYNNVTGSGNVFLGYNAGYNEYGSNKLYIANSNTSTPLIKGDFTSQLIQLNTSTGGTQVTGSLTVTQAITTQGDLNANGTTVGFNVSPSSRYWSFTDATDPFGNLVTLYLSGSGIVSVPRPYMQLGTKGLNIGNKINVLSFGTQLTGSVTIKDSSNTSENQFNNDQKSNVFYDISDDLNQFSVALSGSLFNDTPQILVETGNKGLNVDNRLKVLSTGVQVTGSLSISGSVASVLTLTPQHPLPAASSYPNSFAVSASTPPVPYFSNGTSWNALY